MANTLHAVTLQINQEDYNNLVEWLATPENKRRGNPLVAVQGVVDQPGSFLSMDVNRAKAVR